MLKKPELLAPAGSFEKAKTAFMYGADAVYMGTSKLSLRTRVDVENEELFKAIEYAHKINKKVYVPINIYARDNMYEEIKEQVQMLNEIKADGVIVADGGVLEIIKECAPDLKIHISTQANTVSYNTCNFWYKNGAKRVILARELNKEEIKEIIKNKPNDLSIEIFIHGAICYGYSGRCHLSDFLSNRMANLGDCSQSCRWSYNMYIEETNKPGNLMPVEQDNNGTYILSSKDLCLINELPEIIEMGVDSLKIEGRLKTEYYLATIINAYRTAIDKCMESPKEYNPLEYVRELEKTKTRGLTTFYFNDKNNKDIQEYEGKQYSEYGEFAGKIVDNECENIYVIEIRNKLSLEDTLELIIPGQIESFSFTIEKLWDIETNEVITHVNPGREGQKVKMQIPIKCEEGWILRRRKV